MSYLHVTDIMGDIVTSTATALEQNINYLYGDVNEIVEKLNILTQTAETRVKKYPLIAMFTDVVEKCGQRTDIQSNITIPTIVICCITNPKYHAEERMTKSFKATLTPIYEEFLRQIRYNVSVHTQSHELIPHEKINRLSWGQSAIFVNRDAGNDFIDAIELRNLEFMIKNNIC